MNNFQLDKQLKSDTYPVLETDDYTLRLHKNALVPWLILVPKTEKIELFLCEPDFKQRIHESVDKLALFLQDYCDADKMNIAALGNVVSQLHIHIIARKTNDFAFPDPVWGKPDVKSYDEVDKNAIIHAIQQYLRGSIE